MITNFKELEISENILKAITDMGFASPSPIQAQALPLLLGKDTDFLGLAATGTGKTAAFGIPLLERIDPKVRAVQALILCPTRELAIQVCGQIQLLGKYIGIRVLPVYGGTGYAEQIQGLKNGATIVVGTPGRVVDHINKGTLKLGSLRTLILDEADEMISMGFKEDLETVLQSVPKNQANTWLFSATMSGDVRHVADTYLNEPAKVQVNRTEMLPSTVEQIYYMVHEYDKPDLLCKLIDAADDFYGIVFCQTKALVSDVNQFLVSRGYRSDCLHGDLEQAGRDRVMKLFRDKKISILVATDVACRGLDVKDISHVVNYSIPRELDNYVHRIGRTGRSGKSGIALSLVTKTHRELIGRIERMTKSRMKEGHPPSGRDIALKKVEKSLALFQKDSAPEKFLSLLEPVWKEALENVSKEEIAARFLLLLFPEIAPGKPTERLADTRVEKSKEERQESRPTRSVVKSPSRDRSFGAPNKAPYARPQHAVADRNQNIKFDINRPQDLFDDSEKPVHKEKTFDKPKSFRPGFKKSFASDKKENTRRTPPWERRTSSPSSFGKARENEPRRAPSESRSQGERRFVGKKSGKPPLKERSKPWG